VVAPAFALEPPTPSDSRSNALPFRQTGLSSTTPLASDFPTAPTTEPGRAPAVRSLTWDMAEAHASAASAANEEQPHHARNPSFLNKIKALASPSPQHTRTTSAATASGASSHAPSSLAEQGEHGNLAYLEAHQTDAEADDEEDSDRDAENTERTKVRRQRKSRRSPSGGGMDSGPNTPLASRFASFMRDHPISGSSGRPSGVRRRATLSDLTDGAPEGGVSEDEGKARLRNALRKGIEGARGFGSGARKTTDNEAQDRRPGNLRRLTALGAFDSTNGPFRQRADRHNSASAQKWRQVKAGLKMLGQRKKDERMKVDHQKSAQLMAELLAGAPAALIFASMFQRDEHRHRKVPVLLDQLKISISDVNSRTDKRGDRDYIYKIDLEYGNGPARMKWTIYRSVNDFVNLHFKYKAQGATEKVRQLRGEDKTKAKMPKFPKSVIPYARGMRGLFEKIQDEEDEHEGGDNIHTAANSIRETNSNGITDGTTTPSSPADAMAGHRRNKSSLAPPRRANTSEIINTSADPDTLTARQRQLYAERSRQKLEIYLQQMIRWLIFRPDSTRLCKFLELSAMAIRLSAEGGYQGKQGLLQIASRKHTELRRKTLQSFGPQALKERHKRRWFLVRHSYIVCVDGPESLNPYDVFLVDSDFAIEKRGQRMIDQQKSVDNPRSASEIVPSPKKAHLLRLYNSERKLKLYARNEKQYIQFKESLSFMMQNTIWAQKQRFNSFAPLRHNVWARWLVDGRDHMWQVSRAIDNAKDFIYIHDWWLSPELYLRRPAAISQKWRLDRLLQRKAQEGVKIFVIVYRNIESAIPIDSEYTKWSLLDLHENICVQRSPNQFRQNQFFWAHHEKICVVDNMMAFVGGVDLCFGRWDDPCHSLTDDKLTGFELDHNAPRDAEHCQLWPGKDYSNPRVQDFYALDRPYEEMYDRTKVPRMPWHDISMQIVGQPARDLGRHFVQRWNYVLRSRIPSRPTPVLMPPPEFDQEELDRLGMTGTCSVQILRSCSPWSIGTPNKVEHSIMNAYCALIKGSDHFVYIENQFYISSCTVEGTTIHNKIGDAIVERAIRAHTSDEKWMACLVIPLMPGFQNEVDSQDGTSVRLIMQCQYRSICRGDTSIFGRLRAAGIEPEKYVRFYSLRKWGKIGPRQCLTTEQLYIHAKCMVVDDRAAIIGSANINERSMLGSRDSELAAVVTDTRMIPSFMADRPYEVGEFPHTLRKRLMREHLGIDVDAIYRREQAAAERMMQDAEMDRIYRSNDYEPTGDYFQSPPDTPFFNATGSHQAPGSASANIDDLKPVDPRGRNGSLQSASVENELSKENKKNHERDLDVEGFGVDSMKRLVDAGDEGFRDSYIDIYGREVLLKQDAPDVERIKAIKEEEEKRRIAEEREKNVSAPARPPWPMGRTDTATLGLLPRFQLPELPALDDTDIGGPALLVNGSDAAKSAVNPLMASIRRPVIHEDCMVDPLAEGFFDNIWHQIAENNTKLFRQVFRCMPDSEVLDWKSYERFHDYNERFMQSQGLGASQARPASGAPAKSGPPGFSHPDPTLPDDLADREAASRPKTRLGSFVDKLRPGSTASTNVSATPQPPPSADNEKSRLAMPPGSPMSAISSVPTAIPSPDQRPLDEKDSFTNDGTLDEKAASAQREQGTPANRMRTVQYAEALNPAAAASTSHTLNHAGSQKRRKRATTKTSTRPYIEEVLGGEEAEELLKLVQGHLVQWPYDWLEKEERGGNWLYSIDQLAPLEIYD